MESEKDRLLSHPHYGDPRVDPSAKRDRGLFDGETAVNPQMPAMRTTSSEAFERRKKRTLRFKRGTVLYRSLFDGNGNPVLPKNLSEAEEYRRDIMQFEDDLEVSQSSLGPGKRKEEIVRKIGTTAYGPFIEVVLRRKDEKGNPVLEKRFVSLLDRSLPRDNLRRRFKEQNR